MAIYQENHNKKISAVLFIGVMFLLFYPLWMIGDRELYRGEGLYAVEALGMDYWLPLVKAHGIVQPDGFPLFPLIANALHYLTGWAMPFVLRFIVIAALGGLVTLVWQSARRAAGIQGAVVAAATMMSCNIIFEKSLDGYPEILGMLFINIAWLLWFYIGTMRNSWTLAWIAGYLFCSIAFYTIGWQAIIIFTVPLIFMRRPLTIWPKLRNPGFFIGLFILTATVIFWLLPYLKTPPNGAFFSPQFAEWSDYLIHILVFPFEVMLRFLPWSILAWAPFCVAFIPLDKTPVFSRFLRTIAYALFFFFWFSPVVDSRNIIFLVPPVAILNGIYYGNVVRRYHRQIKNILKPFAVSIIAISAIIYTIYLIPGNWWQEVLNLHHGISFVTQTKYISIAVVSSAMLATVGLWLLLRMNHLKIWQAIMLIMLAVVTFFWIVMFPYRAQNHEKEQLGAEIRMAMQECGAPPDSIIYKNNILDLYGECYYSGYKVRRIMTVHDIPSAAATVYLLSIEFPEMPERRWSDLLPKNKTYHGKRLRLLRGDRIDKKGGSKP